MQDRLLQLVQIFQYVRFKNQVYFNMIVTNECVQGVNLNHDSKLAYESLGFNTDSVTQDFSMIGAFGIKTEDPIPIVHYGDCYTWSKYGYHVLHPTTERICRNGELKGYRHALRCLLRADLYQMNHFQLEIHTESELSNLLKSCIPEDTPLENRGAQFDLLFANDENKTKTLFKKLQEIATYATVIPLSIFTNFFHQRYPKHRYLESTLELLQQFYLCVEEASDDSHKMFPGEKYFTSLKCIRCNKRVTSGTSGIVDTLLQAPTATYVICI